MEDAESVMHVLEMPCFLRALLPIGLRALRKYKNDIYQDTDIVKTTHVRQLIQSSQIDLAQKTAKTSDVTSSPAFSTLHIRALLHPFST